MKTLRHLVPIILLLGSLAARAQDTIVIKKPADNKVIPITITGLTGDADAVLKFDLSVMGMELVAPEKADFLISGAQNGRLEGRLKSGGPAGAEIFARAYSNGSVRSQAHAFAEDVVKAVLDKPEMPPLAPIFHTRIAFCRNDGASTEICVSDFDGNDHVQMTKDNFLVATPSWSPGGRELFYTSWSSGNTQILEHDAATGARKVFASYGGANFNPVVSPDGGKVAMILSKGGSPNLYVCDSNGGNLRQLTSGHDEASSPTWSPDGREICFVVRSGRAALWKISADGGTPRALRAGGPRIFGNLTSPDWSPDGKQIIFTCGSGNFNICVVPAEGGTAENLVAGEDPCWAPNSRTVIFTRRINHKGILSLLDVPTKHVKDVGQISGSCSQPAWAR
jgi:TolB protein